MRRRRVRPAGVVAAIGPDEFEPIEALADAVKHQGGAVPVLNGGGVNHHAQGQAFGIDESVDLAPLHLLAGVITHCVRFAFRASPFSADLSEQLSMTPALGLASRPSRSRRAARSFPDRLPHALSLESAEDVVDRRARREVFAGQISPWATGSQEKEDRFIAERMSVLRGRPPGFAAGITAPSDPIPHRADRSRNPQFGDTAPVSLRPHPELSLKTADDPVNIPSLTASDLLRQARQESYQRSWRVTDVSPVAHSDGCDPVWVCDEVSPSGAWAQRWRRRFRTRCLRANSGADTARRSRPG